MSVALLAAAVAAVGYGIGSVVQSAAAGQAHGPAVLRRPAYLVGLGCDVAAWSCSLVAVRGLPLLVAQSVLTASLAVTVLLAPLVTGVRLRVRDVGTVVVVVGALTVVATGTRLDAKHVTPATAPLVVAGALAALTALTVLLYRRGRTVALAALAGAAFGAVAVCVRLLPPDWSRWPHDPVTPTLLGLAVVGNLLYARALERGAVGAATAAMWWAELVVAGGTGMVLLGDATRPGWRVATLVAVLVAAAGCTALATGSVVPTGGRDARCADLKGGEV